MTEQKSKHHVQLPNNMTKSGELTPKDLLVYVTIKSYMNKDSKECYPSLDTIVERSGISKPTVRKAINVLKKENYLSVRIEGRKNVYRFNSYKTFEPFSYDFVKDTTIEPNLKAYIIASQQLMFKDVEGFGKISYTDSELSELINMDKRTIAKYNKTLEEKGYLSIIKTNKKDNITGLRIDEKIFHLDELGQAIIWTLQKHEEDINELKEQTSNTAKDIKIMTKGYDELEKRLTKSEIENKVIIDLLLKNKIDISEIDNECQRRLNNEVII